MPFTPFRRPTAKQLNAIINSEDLFLAPSFTCTDTSYEDFTSASLSFEKRMSDTESDLRIRIDAAGFLVATPSVNCTLGVNIDGDDYDITLQRFNLDSTHFCWGRSRRLSGIPAGTYTVQVRAKLDTAARSVTFSSAGSGGQLGMVVEEILL